MLFAVTWRRYVVLVVVSVAVFSLTMMFSNQREAINLSTNQERSSGRRDDTPTDSDMYNSTISPDVSAVDHGSDGVTYATYDSASDNSGDTVSSSPDDSAAEYTTEDSITFTLDDTSADSAGDSTAQTSYDSTAATLDDGSYQNAAKTQLRNQLDNREDNQGDNWEDNRENNREDNQGDNWEDNRENNREDNQGDNWEDNRENNREDNQEVNREDNREDNQEVNRENNREDNQEVNREDNQEENREDNREDNHFASPSVCSTSARAARVRDLCRAHGYDKEPISWGSLRRNLIVDDRHRIMFCSIPKCGSKSFKHYLGQISNPDFFVGWSVDMNKYFNVTGLRWYADLGDPERETVLNEYLKFIVVRHPFDRLRSAWQHKMGEAGSSHVLRGVVDIVDDHLRRLDPARTRRFDYRDELLEFDHFLELVHRRWDSGFRNAHWASYYHLCQPCHVPYDHVFRLETLPDDVEVIYRHLAALNSSEAGYRIAHDNKVRPAEGIARMKGIERVYREVGERTTRGLLELYRKDFSLFGYKWDADSGATCLYDDIDCC